jgi:hypothetical protein
MKLDPDRPHETDAVFTQTLISLIFPKSNVFTIKLIFQEGADCVFTPAATINNRSLFPCQEPPIAMATWQASIFTSSQGY